MDFLLTELKILLDTFLEKGYKTFTFNSFLQNNSDEKQLIIRHDIDKNPENALKIALLEKKLKIRATFYFRIHPTVFKQQTIKKIADMGHEIGYHYEDFTKFHGNPEKAIESFKYNLEKLRQIYPVQTICMDGRPLSKYNNLDLWKYYNYKDFGISGEPFLDIDFNKVLYLTDTGRGWNLIKYNVRDKVQSPFKYHNATTQQLIADIKDSKLPDKIMITIHPQRWHDRSLPWLTELVLQRIKNGLKWGLIKVRGEKS